MPKKSTKEDLNAFHLIIKASAIPKKFDAEKCPKCGSSADFLPLTTKDGRNLVLQFKCPNGHQFSKYITVR